MTSLRAPLAEELPAVLELYLRRRALDAPAPESDVADMSGNQDPFRKLAQVASLVVHYVWQK